MSEAVRAYRQVAASPEFRELERMRSKRRHDEAQALKNAERKRDAHWQVVVDKKDAELAEKDAELAKVAAKKDAELAKVAAKKDAELAEKDAENAKLRAQLEEVLAQNDRK